MNALESMTLAELARLGDLNPSYARIVDRILVQNYEDFIRVLYADIDQCVIQMERNRELRQDSSEDHLTVELVSMLTVMGYTAVHEAKTGGHVDLIVSHAKGYEWLAEAKKHSTYEHLFEGFLQLCTRYSSGSPNAKCGGIIAYIKNRDVAKVVSEWRSRLNAKRLPNYQDWECQTRTGLSFFSQHSHDVSGLPYTVRHIAVMLYHSPMDKSSRRRKKGPTKSELPKSKVG